MISLRGRRSLRRGAVLSTMIAGLVGCDSPPPAAPSLGVLAKGLSLACPAVAEPIASGDVRPLTIFLDGSASMRGFVWNRNSRYLVVMRSMIDRAATSGVDMTVSVFPGDQLIRRGLTAAVAAPDLYDGGNTPLASEIQRIASVEGASLLISDMVLSEGGKDQLDLVRAFRQLVTARRVVRLLAFRSSFSGTFFIETQPTSSRKVSLDGQTLARPFYILAVASSETEMDRLTSTVLRDVSADFSFDPGTPSVHVRQAKRAGELSGRRFWNLSKPFQITSACNGAFRLQTELSESENNKPLGKSGIAFDVTYDTVVPLLSVDRAAAETVGVRGSGLAQQETGLEVSLSSSSPQGFKVTYSLPRPERSSWSAFLIRLRPGRGNVGVPDWISKLNADDDHAEDAETRTLGLRVLVQALSNAITENSVFFEHVLLLGRGAR